MIDFDFRFKAREKGHPQRVVQRLFRVGRYLELPSKIPTSCQRSVEELISLYKPHIEGYGKESIAQLCPPKCDFECLTIEGIDLVYPQSVPTETMIVDTIDELRELLDKLECNPKIRVFVHMQSLKELRRKRDLTRMRKLLGEWNAIR